ncbi:MAG: class I SAM-dependent methyltransferase [Kofleriaceae bacterium]
MSETYLKDNLRLWDERVATHLDTEFYGMDRFRRGGSSLTHIEREALPDVAGKRLLHLQCHFGQDTLSWARLGAEVTGMDFSPKAIATARALSAELGLPARFLLSDLYGLPDLLDETFDLVFTSYGVLKWLPDIQRWGEIVARYLRPGGTFFLVEFHPFTYVFDYDRAEQIAHPYFVGDDPISYDEEGTYADLDAGPKTVHRAHSWPHPVSRVISALLRAGLHLESFEEYPYSTLGCFPFVREQGPERFVHKTHPGMVPLLYSIKATRP